MWIVVFSFFGVLLSWKIPPANGQSEPQEGGMPPSGSGVSEAPPPPRDNIPAGGPGGSRDMMPGADVQGKNIGAQGVPKSGPKPLPMGDIDKDIKNIPVKGVDVGRPTAAFDTQPTSGVSIVEPEDSSLKKMLVSNEERLKKESDDSDLKKMWSDLISQWKDTRHRYQPEKSSHLMENPQGIEEISLGVMRQLKKIYQKFSLKTKNEIDLEMEKKWNKERKKYFSILPSLSLEEWDLETVEAQMMLPTRIGFERYREIANRYVEADRIEEAATVMEKAIEFSQGYAALPEEEKRKVHLSLATLYEMLGWKKKLFLLYLSEKEKALLEAKNIQKMSHKISSNHYHMDAYLLRWIFVAEGKDPKNVSALSMAWVRKDKIYVGVKMENEYFLLTLDAKNGEILHQSGVVADVPMRVLLPMSELQGMLFEEEGRLVLETSVGRHEYDTHGRDIRTEIFKRPFLDLSDSKLPTYNLSRRFIKGKIVLALPLKFIKRKIVLALESKDVSNRLNAAKVLREMRDPSTVHPLIEALKKDKDSSVRGTAAYALGEIKDPSAVEPLIEALDDRMFHVRETAYKALEKIRDR